MTQVEKELIKVRTDRISETAFEAGCRYAESEYKTEVLICAAIIEHCTAIVKLLSSFPDKDK